jgi:hypothetical protein
MPPVTPYLRGSNILCLSLCSSLNVIDQVSHPYKTMGKIIVLYILIFTFCIQQTRRQSVLDSIVASVARILSLSDFLLNHLFFVR